MSSDYQQNGVNRMSISEVSAEDAQGVLSRLKLIFDVKTDSALANALKTSPQTVSSWKVRNRVPYAECVHVAMIRNISLDWLLAGVGPMLRGGAGQPADFATYISDSGDSLSGLFRSLEEGDLKAIRLMIEEKIHMRDMERRLEALSAALAGAERPT